MKMKECLCCGSIIPSTSKSCSCGNCVGMYYSHFNPIATTKDELEEKQIIQDYNRRIEEAKDKWTKDFLKLAKEDFILRDYNL
uniref:Uncharacterized protein n=1 Tax=viral metagenome TaxID=1070528 RepID=A0A6H1ZWF5_9ZZZZ